MQLMEKEKMVIIIIKIRITIIIIIIIIIISDKSFSLHYTRHIKPDKAKLI